MHSLVRAGIIFAVVCFLASCRSVTALETIEIDQYKTETLEGFDLERGQVLADIMMCSTCHTYLSTKDGLQIFNDDVRLSGGIKIVSPPDGVFYSSNITPDEETGIGNWKVSDIKRAITKGIGKEGNGLRVMPYQFYSRITEEDLNSLVGYLRNLPPIRHRIPDNESLSAIDKIVAGFRFVIPFIEGPSQDWFYGDAGNLAEVADHSPKKPYSPSPKSIEPLIIDPIETTPEIEKGKYLVTIAACAFCHTPVTIRGQSKALAFAGGFKVVDPICGTIYSRNITSDKETGIGDWSKEEVADAIRHGISRDGRRLCSVVMPWPAYSNLTNSDTMAIAAYLKALPPIKHKVLKSDEMDKPLMPIQKFIVGDHKISF